MCPTRSAAGPLLWTDNDLFPFPAPQLARIRQAGFDVRMLDGHEPVDIARAGTDALALFAFYARIDEDLLSRLPRCRVIGRCGTGYDRIDVVAARDRGILVTYVPSYGADDVAEHAVTLMLSCARRLGAIDRAVQAGGWPSYPALGPLHRVAGSTIGLLGLGRIGKEVALRAKGLKQRVIAHDPFAIADDADALGVELVCFAELLERADYLSVHVPLTPQTHHLLDADAIRHMRPTAVLLNTSRGPIIDQGALITALDEGWIAGAGLDVLEREPPELSDRILDRPNVVITPHSAAYSEEALGELIDTAVRDVLTVLRDEIPRHLVPELEDQRA